MLKLFALLDAIKSAAVYVTTKKILHPEDTLLCRFVDADTKAKLLRVEYQVNISGDYSWLYTLSLFWLTIGTRNNNDFGMKALENGANLCDVYTLISAERDANLCEIDFKIDQINSDLKFDKNSLSEAKTVL